MVFIPMVAQQQVPPSPRALDLARRLKEEIDKFERQYPGTSREELRAAAALALGQESEAMPARRRIAAAVVGMIAALGGLGFMMNFAGGKDIGAAAAILVAAATAGVIAVAIARSRQ